MSGAQPSPHAGRPFVGIYLRCCNAYSRAYLSADKSRFEGRCPKCGRFVKLPATTQGGSPERFFEAG